MSSYRIFAIWGAGNLGGSIADHLLKQKATVVILTRPASVNSARNLDSADKGIEIRPFDILSTHAADSLKDVDVLISTPAIDAIHLQPQLLEAAHAAGVKLFVPAEFGDTTDGRTEVMLRSKVAVREQAAKLGLPTIAFFTGLWPEFLIYRGFDLPAGKITILGDGDAQMSATSIRDIAAYVAYVLTTLPKDQLEDAKFSLQGDVITFNSLAASIQELSSKPIEIVRIPRFALEAKLKSDPNDLVTEVLLGLDDGKGLHPNQLSHDLFPGWCPKMVMDVLKPYIQ